MSHLSLDFPESKAAIEDLKFCLERTNQRQQLLTSLKSAFESRLLHPGELAAGMKVMVQYLFSDNAAEHEDILIILCWLYRSFSGVHTSDILTVYISAIKALRELDPSMVILQVACQPIRKYLR